MNKDIIDVVEIPTSTFDRAYFFWLRFLYVVPLHPATLRPAQVGTDWRRQRMNLDELTAVFKEGQHEVGLGTRMGAIIIEAPDPIFGWIHQTMGLPFAVTERHGLYSSFYRYDGTKFENSLHPAQEAPIRIHYQSIVVAPGTPEPGRKTLFLRNGGARFESWWLSELQRESAAWRQARRHANAIHLSENARTQRTRGTR